MTDEVFQTVLYSAFALWNIAVFVMYLSDKHRAITKRRRISEKSLLAAAFLFGGAGAFLGMNIFRHKTKNIKFAVLLPLAGIVSMVELMCCRYIILL